MFPRGWRFTLAAAAATVVITSAPAYAAVHTVVPGESLWTISQLYGSTVNSLLAANDLKGDLIVPGQKLIVPDKTAAELEAPAAIQPVVTAASTQEPEAVEPSAADTAPEVRYTVAAGDTLYAIGQKYGISAEAIMAANGLTSTEIQSGQVLLLPQPGKEVARNGTTLSRGSSERSQRAASLLDLANSLKGRPYRYGAAGPSAFDCSGFTAYIFAQFGKDLPHNSASQFNLGQPVSRADLEPGDLVFFGYYGSRDIRHVGIYVGGNSFIHASTSGGVKYSSLADPYYANNYKGAKRIL